MTEMKTLTILGKTYEIVDDKARSSVTDLETQIEGVLDTIPKATTGTIVQADNTITVTLNLTDGDTTTSVITMSNGYPSTIVTDGLPLTLTWEGFDTTAAASEEETEVTTGE